MQNSLSNPKTWLKGLSFLNYKAFSLNKALLLNLCVEGLALLSLTLLPFLVFWRLWAPKAVDRLLLRGDILVGAYPNRYYGHDLMQAGIQPWWNPYQLSGMPHLADVQVALYYLPNLILDWLSWGKPLNYLAVEALVIAHYALGGIFLFAYLRGLGVHSIAALVGSIAFEFNGFFIGHRGHYNMVAVVVWLPVIMWLLDLAWRQKRLEKRLIWALMAALALSQMIMAGHPQVTFYCSLFLGIYFLYRWGQCWSSWPGFLRGSWSERLSHPLLQRPLTMGLTGILAGGIAAITLLPSAELLSRSLRNDLSYTFSAQFPLMPRNLITLLIPEFLNWSETEFRIYAGILTLLLVTVAWVIPQKTYAERDFFGFVLVIALMASFGAFTALHSLSYRFIPGYDSVRVSARIFFFANFALAVLAAFGAETLFGQLNRKELLRLKAMLRQARWGLAFVFVIASLLYLGLIWTYQSPADDFYFYDQLLPLNRSLATAEDNHFMVLTQTTNAFLLFVTFLIVALGILWLRAQERLGPVACMTALVGLMILDMASYAPDHDTVQADFESDPLGIQEFNVSKLEDWEGREQALLIETLQNLPLGLRVENVDHTLPENFSAIWKIPFSTGYNILDIAERAQMQTQWPYLLPSIKRDLFNVAYILTPADHLDAPEVDAKMIFENSQGKIWERAKQPSYIYFSPQIRPVLDILALNGLLLQDPNQYQIQPSVSTEGDLSLKEILEAHWPQIIETEHYEIGQTGIMSPVDISVLSGGLDGYSVILIDGKSVTPEQRGMIFAIIDPQSGQLLQSGAYDTYQSTAQSDRLAAELDTAPEGSILALATYDEGTANLSDKLRESLSTFGAHEKIDRGLGQAYSLIGVKGSKAGKALEKIGQTAQVIDVGIGAANRNLETGFQSELLAYTENQITFMAHTNITGLVALSESMYPGWEALLDGQSVPILRVNGMLRGLILPPGTHEVSLIYNPNSIRLGSLISVLSLTLAAGMLSALLALTLFRRPKAELSVAGAQDDFNEPVQ